MRKSVERLLALSAKTFRKKLQVLFLMRVNTGLFPEKFVSDPQRLNKVYEMLPTSVEPCKV